MGLSADFQWWQLWTCHLWHWDWRHLLVNVLAAVPPLLLVPPRSWQRLVAGFVVAAPALSLTLLVTGMVEGEYRGASGLVVALWFATALGLIGRGERATGFILLAAVSSKIVVELGGWWPPASVAFDTLPAAHYTGAVIGLLCGMFSPQRHREHREPLRPLRLCGESPTTRPAAPAASADPTRAWRCRG